MAGSPYRWPYMFEKNRRFYAVTPLFHGGATYVEACALIPSLTIRVGADISSYRYALLPATVRSGGTVILARKFSVRNFWPDVRRTRANMLFYIGEMVRYLVQAPPDPVHSDEKKMHGMEIIYGLGIAAPVWKAFRERFGVPWITEYYGATEATSSISYSNVSNDVPVAKVAHWGPLMRSPRFGGQDTFYLLKLDWDTGEFMRDPKTGLCIQVDWDEIGEAVNRVIPGTLQRVHDYVGSGGAEATKKKLISDVFEKGDLFWRLGDALSMVSASISVRLMPS
jgi:acyl-CoA synthetase (AMP-forming)/AMP-acid ligase II